MFDPKTIAAELEPTTRTLTSHTQQDVFNFIVRFFEVNTTSPTIAEICEGVAAIQGGRVIKKDLVHYHLRQLQRRGKIKLAAGANRRTATRVIVNFASWKFHGYRQVRFKKEILP